MSKKLKYAFKQDEYFSKQYDVSYDVEYNIYILNNYYYYFVNFIRHHDGWKINSIDYWRQCLYWLSIKEVNICIFFIALL